MRYVLAPRAVSARARVVAASGTAVAIAPGWLVVVLVAQLGLASRGVTAAIAVAIGVLGLLRGFLQHRRAMRRLAAFAIEIDGDTLTVVTAGGLTRVPAGAIVRVTEMNGVYGGLRVDLAGAGLPSRFDVPRGGDAFVEVRSWLAARAPIERSPRRGRAARIALVAAVILGLFFAPFVVADARGSRVAITLVLLVAWGAMRAVAARG